MTANLDALLVGMSQILQDASIKSVSEEVTLTLAELRGTSEETSRLLKSPEIRTFLQNAAEASVGANIVIDNLTETSRAIKTGSLQLPPFSVPFEYYHPQDGSNPRSGKPRPI